MAIVTESRIYWSEKEWDQLAELVFAMRRNHPEQSVSALVNRAQKQFPEDRRRTGLSNHAIRPLLDRLRALDSRLREAQDEAASLRARIAIYDGIETRDQVLSSLTDDEILRFGDRLLGLLTPNDVIAAFPTEEMVALIPVERLVGVAAQRFAFELLHRKIETSVLLPKNFLTDAKIRQPSVSRQTPKKRPRIVMVGLKGNQPQHVRERLEDICELTFLDVSLRDGHAIPTSADHVFIWSNFVSHIHRNVVRSRISTDRITEHHGGLQVLIDKAEQWLKNN